jgi:hypothetical protein
VAEHGEHREEQPGQDHHHVPADARHELLAESGHALDASEGGLDRQPDAEGHQRVGGAATEQDRDGQ